MNERTSPGPVAAFWQLARPRTCLVGVLAYVFGFEITAGDWALRPALGILVALLVPAIANLHNLLGLFVFSLVVAVPFFAGATVSNGWLCFMVLFFMAKGPVTFQVPKAGFFLWIRLPENTSGNRVYEAALRRGVRVLPGSAFSVIECDHQYVRVSYSCASTGQLAAGIDTLAGVIED